jgi:outer membrane protein assembly factor BamB
MDKVRPDTASPAHGKTRIRWWPVRWILSAAAVAGLAVWLWPISQVQVRNLILYSLGGITLLLLGVWWLFASRVSWRTRFTVLLGFAVCVGALGASFRFRGVTGDLVPILEKRWTPRAASQTTPPRRAAGTTTALDDSGRPDFPQYLGTGRDAVIRDGPALSADWKSTPPQVLWRQPIGPGWAGFAIVGNRAITLEQRGSREMVVCLDVLTGDLLWEHGDDARYASPLGGEGPRTTPTVVGRRVFTFGATGILNCLALDSGKLLWQRRMAEEAPGCLPEWGYAGSPLVHEGKVVISSGQGDGKSLRAYRVEDGSPLWAGGSRAAGYASPMLCTLAGVPQLIVFNLRFITAHDPATGAVLWERPWGNRQPVVAQPLPIGPDLIVFSSGYGVGAELLKIGRDSSDKLNPQLVWKSLALKAKMASFIENGGFLYGLDDGMLTCVDTRDGKRRWKSGRYGHGQLLWVDGRLLVTAESGELVLLEPGPSAPNEVARFPVFDAKLWNPPALSGDLLLVRTDQEAACLRLPLARSARLKG